jgi:formylglycine-generating enzyme required for sulfatase activity
LVLSASGQRISLRLDEARNLQKALSKACESLEEKLKNESALFQEIRAEMAAASERWAVNGTLETRDSALEAFSSGRLDDGFELLCQEHGHSLALDAVTAWLDIDLEGWVMASAELSVRSYPAICHLASSSPADHVLRRMWTEGCFDSFLLRCAGVMAPEQVPSSLHARLFGVLAQESHVPAGEFIMGSDDIDAWAFEGPRHRIQFSEDYSIMRFPVTQFLYWMICGENPSLHVGASRPVDQVSWKDAVNFCIQYASSQGLASAYSLSDDDQVLFDPSAPGHRLPTEAEWECGAKAWSDSKFAGGDDPDSVAWLKENSGESTRVVGQKKANPLGLYDMSGNIWEWCWDHYSPETYGDGSDRRDPLGSGDGSERVCRGGGFGSPALSARVSIRGRFSPETKWDALGFRLVRTVPKITRKDDPR